MLLIRVKSAAFAYASHVGIRSRGSATLATSPIRLSISPIVSTSPATKYFSPTLPSFSRARTITSATSVTAAKLIGLF